MNFSIIDALLGVAFFTATTLAILLFYKSKDISSKFLAATTFGAAIWVFANLLIRNTDLTTLAAKLMYVVAVFSLIVFVLFAYTFNNERLKSKKKYFITALGVFVGFSCLIIFSDMIVGKAVLLPGTKSYKYIFGPFYYLYVTFIVVAVILGYFFLIGKYMTIKNKIARTQLTYIVIGSSVSLVTAVTAALILPLFGNFKYLLVGPVFIIAYVIFASYVILRHHLFKIKLVTTELMVFAILTVVFTQVFMAGTIKLMIVRIVFFLIILLFCIFLVRSVYKEIDQRLEIERLAQRLSNFVSFTTHELSTPISKFRWSMIALLNGDCGRLPREAKEWIKRSFETATDMGESIEIFLNLNKLEIGKLELSKQKIDLKDMVNNCLISFAAKAKEKKIKMNSKALCGVCDVEIDKFQIRHVVNNLISNAIKYTPEKGRVKIEISKNKEKNEIIVSVIDNGIGVPLDILPSLFHLYERGAKEAKMISGGSGIGLFLVKKLVEMHNSRVWAESKGKDKGSVFSFSLPL